MLKKILILLALMLLFVPVVAPVSAKKTIEIRINYEAQEKQIVFHNSDADITVFGGAKGGGKSCSLVMDCVNFAQWASQVKQKQAICYLFRKTIPKLKESLILELQSKVPQININNPFGLYLWNDTERKAYIPPLSAYTSKGCKYKTVQALKQSPKIHYNSETGFYESDYDRSSIICFAPCENETDASAHRGKPQLHYIGVDELTEHTEKAISELISCLRSVNGLPTRFKASCNPGGIGHAYVKDKFIKSTDYGKNVIWEEYDHPTIKDKKIRLKTVFIPSKVKDNKYITENDPMYIIRLMKLPEHLRKAYLDGDWDLFENQYFTNFSTKLHVIPHFEIPKEWKKWRAVDAGYTDPFWWGWFAVDLEGRVHVYREFTRTREEKKLEHSLQAQRVIQLSTNQDTTPENIETTVKPRDTLQKHNMTVEYWRPQGKTITDAYNEGGLCDFTEAIQNRAARALTMAEYLIPFKVNSMYNHHVEHTYCDETGQEWTAKLLIHDNCPSLIDAFQAIEIDPISPECYKENSEVDHPLDGCGYGLLYHHPPTSKPEPQESEYTQEYYDSYLS